MQVDIGRQYLRETHGWNVSYSPASVHYLTDQEYEEMKMLNGVVDEALDGAQQCAPRKTSRKKRKTA